MISIMEAQPCHLRALAPNLRAEDAAEVDAFCMSPMKALMRSWRAAVIRRTATVDGEVAAVWGCGGSLLGGEGRPWLLTSPAVERVRKTFVRVGRDEVGRMLAIYPYLHNMVPASYDRALRFLDVIGFDIGSPEPFGPRGVLFCRVEMKRA